MIVPGKQQNIEKSVSTDERRPVLSNPFLVYDGEQGLLCATDSYQAVMIPVETDGDIAGPVPMDAVRAARRKTSDGRIELGETTATVRGIRELVDGEARYVRPDGKAPNMLKIRDDALALGKPIIRIGLNGVLLAQIQSALGCDHTGVVLDIYDPMKAIIVRTPSFKGGMGIAMPIRVNDR